MNLVSKSAIPLAVLLSSFSLAGAEAKTPDATFSLSAKTAAAVVGYEWGSGTLQYKGADYPFAIKALNFLDVGGANIEATGEVYNLSKVEDFAGRYIGVGAGAALVDGASSGAMQNHSGVVIHVHSNTKGAELKASVGTMEVKLQ
jgi:hypothetical protein